jgi:hypothetical protein
MIKPKRAYQNAGMQTQQGRLEMHRWGDAPASDLFTVKCISLVLGIRLQKVTQIPVQRIMIDKRGYYRKGDIQAWAAEDAKQPESLLAELNAEHAKTVARIKKQPSRIYRAGELNTEEAKEAQAKTKTNRLKEPDEYEAWRYPKSVEYFWRALDGKKS